MRDSKQQDLFDTEPPAWELDDVERHWIATVVVPNGPPQELDYLVPDALARTADVAAVCSTAGRANRTAVGYCVRLENRPAGTRRLKPLAAVIDEASAC